MIRRYRPRDGTSPLIIRWARASQVRPPAAANIASRATDKPRTFEASLAIGAAKCLGRGGTSVPAVARRWYMGTCGLSIVQFAFWFGGRAQPRICAPILGVGRCA